MIKIPSKVKRSNIFWFILYPESAPEHWREILKRQHCPTIISPLHNFDYWSKLDEEEAQAELKNDYYSDEKIKEMYKEYKEGSKNISSYSAAEQKVIRDISRLEEIRFGVQKKPHYHIIIDYGKNANKTIEQCVEDFTLPLHCPKPKIVTMLRGAVRYLVHLDDKDKAQYNINDVVIMNDFFVSDFFVYSSEDEFNAAAQIQDFIFQRKINNYADLCFQTEKVPVWHKYVTTHTCHLKELFAELHMIDHYDVKLQDEAVEFYENQKRRVQVYEDNQAK